MSNACRRNGPGGETTGDSSIQHEPPSSTLTGPGSTAGKRPAQGRSPLHKGWEFFGSVSICVRDTDWTGKREHGGPSPYVGVGVLHFQASQQCTRSKVRVLIYFFVGKNVAPVWSGREHLEAGWQLQGLPCPHPLWLCYEVNPEGLWMVLSLPCPGGEAVGLLVWPPWKCASHPPPLAQLGALWNSFLSPSSKAGKLNPSSLWPSSAPSFDRNCETRWTKVCEKQRKR